MTEDAPYKYDCFVVVVVVVTGNVNAFVVF